MPFFVDDSTDNDLLYPKEFGRGYDESQVEPMEMPKLKFGDAPGEMKIIPKSDWSDIIREKNEKKSGLAHMREYYGPGGGRVPTLDQNGQGYCHTADTEVLTSRGFVRWSDYNWSDELATVNPANHAMEFQSPIEKHVYEYDGEMIYSTNRRVNFGVTPDHQMYVRKWDEAKRTLSDKYSFVRAADIGWYAGLLHAPGGWLGTDLVEVEVPGDRRYDGDDFFAMLGLVVSDGFAGGSFGDRPGKGTRSLVSFASFREETREIIASLGYRLGFSEAPSRRGVWSRWNAGALAEWIRQNCYSDGLLGSRNKKVPEIVKVASMRQIKIFLRFFDDRNRAGTQFYSTSKRLIDDLQELHMRIGKRSSIGWDDAKDVPYDGAASGVIKSNGGYVLTVGETDRLCIDRKKHIEQDRYKGLVYCAAVPNHTLITRRNGTTLISSNCWAYSVSRMMMYWRMLMNLPTVRLSGHAIGCMVKNFRDEGGWCGLSYKFAMERGIPSVDFWKEKSMDRSNDNQATWDNAAGHKIVNGWYQLDLAVYDQNMLELQIGTCLLRDVAVAADFPWWSHSVCLKALQEPERGSFAWDLDNSWTDGWGENGAGLIRGNKMKTAGAVALIASTTALN